MAVNLCSIRIRPRDKVLLDWVKNQNTLMLGKKFTISDAIHYLIKTHPDIPDLNQVKDINFNRFLKFN